jgi:2-polyprenyl-3-methyl-5-hydroxy-6-metoxy-1,4-benzoquinol methylase
MEIMTAAETPQWKIRACAACTNAWTDPAPGTIDYATANFHAHAVGATTARKSLADLPAQWRDSVVMQVSLLKKNLPAAARILEIGCGEGILLAELARAGFNVLGVEASETASAAARAAGLNVLTGYFPHSAARGPFDCIVISQVLEHLENPREILGEIAKLLAPDGRLLLVQTHWLGLMPQRYKEKWYAWVPDQHYWHFTPRGLEILAAPFGFTTETVEFSSLVHTREDGTLNQFSTIALTTPAGGDQFHLLLRRSR